MTIMDVDLPIARNCATHGQYVGTERTPWCPVCREAENEELDRKNEERQAWKRLARTETPPCYQGMTLADFICETPAQREMRDAAQDFIWNFPDQFRIGRSLVFVGPPGTGKTMLASIIAGCLVNISFLTGSQYSGDIYRAEYVTAGDVLRQARDTWRKRETSETAVINHFANVDLLVIDEIGAQSPDSERPYLHDLIDKRYQRSLPTIAITNWSTEGLVNALGEPAMSRLLDKGRGSEMLSFNWPSWRESRRHE